MNMIGNGNNVIGNYKVSSNGIPAYYDKRKTSISVSIAATASNRVFCFESMALALI